LGRTTAIGPNGQRKEEHPSYANDGRKPFPCLSVAQAKQELDTIAAEIDATARDRLPIKAATTEVILIENSNVRWTQRAKFGSATEEGRRLSAGTVSSKLAGCTRAGYETAMQIRSVTGITHCRGNKVLPTTWCLSFFRIQRAKTICQLI
jgi:hypothetical protein